MIFFILGLAMAIYGFLCYKYPEKMWWTETGSKTEKGKPADLFMSLSVYGGIVMMVSGVLLAIYGFFQW